MKGPLAIMEQKETFLDLLIDNRMTELDQISLLAKNLQIRAIYIFDKRNKLDVSITISSFRGTEEMLALIDSGAMENFISHEEIKRLKIGTQKLDDPIRLRNVDGTYNQTGKVTHFTNLIVS